MFNIMLKYDGKRADTLLSCVEAITDAYATKHIKSVRSPHSQPSLTASEYTTSNEFLSLMITHQRFLNNAPSTRLVLTKNITDNYPSWNCLTDSYPCNGIFVKEIEYDATLFHNVTNDMITNVFRFELLSPETADVVQNLPIWYNFTLPIKDNTINVNDPIQVLTYLPCFKFQVCLIDQICSSFSVYKIKFTKKMM